jgi:hypothetical protein
VTPYSITLRSRTDATITGWYDGSSSRWSTDHTRQKRFDDKHEAKSIRDELRGLCPRNAEVINVEPKADRRERARGSGRIQGLRLMRGMVSNGKLGTIVGICSHSPQAQHRSEYLTHRNLKFESSWAEITDALCLRACWDEELWPEVGDGVTG